jgi:membrane associated rhomboid family serine protease
MGRLTWMLIIANLIVFELAFSLPGPQQDFVFQLLSFSQGTAFEPWRWLTSLFMHASASHLFFNMLGLYFFGKILEEEVSGRWFLAIFFASGLLGNLAFMFTGTLPVVGASGAMFGVMGAAMLLNPLKRVYMYVFPLPLGIVAVSFVILETLVVYFQPAQFSNIAHVSHVAGMVAGSLYALFYETRRALKGALVLVVCLLLLIFLSPIFGLITGIGSIILQGLDFMIGLALYNLAGLIGLLWI